MSIAHSTSFFVYLSVSVQQCYGTLPGTARIPECRRGDWEAIAVVIKMHGAQTDCLAGVDAHRHYRGGVPLDQRKAVDDLAWLRRKIKEAEC